MIKDRREAVVFVKARQGTRCQLRERVSRDHGSSEDGYLPPAVAQVAS